jgi:hypothetical protein
MKWKEEHLVIRRNFRKSLFLFLQPMRRLVKAATRYANEISFLVREKVDRMHRLRARETFFPIKLPAASDSAMELYRQCSAATMQISRRNRDRSIADAVQAI